MWSKSVAYHFYTKACLTRQTTKGATWTCIMCMCMCIMGGGKANLCSASWCDMDTNGVDFKHVVYHGRNHSYFLVLSRDNQLTRIPYSSVPVLCLSQKIRITSVLAVFLKHGQTDFSRASNSISHHLTELQKRADRADQSVLIFPGRC